MNETELSPGAQVYLIDQRGCLRTMGVCIVFVFLVLGYQFPKLFHDPAEWFQNVPQVDFDQESAGLLQDEAQAASNLLGIRSLLQDLQQLELISSIAPSLQGRRSTRPSANRVKSRAAALLSSYRGPQLSAHTAKAGQKLLGPQVACMLTGVRHGPNGGEIGCRIDRDGEAWHLYARNAQCYAVCWSDANS